MLMSMNNDLKRCKSAFEPTCDEYFPVSSANHLTRHNINNFIPSAYLLLLLPLMDRCVFLHHFIFQNQF